MQQTRNPFSRVSLINKSLKSGCSQQQSDYRMQGDTLTQFQAIKIFRQIGRATGLATVIVPSHFC